MFGPGCYAICTKQPFINTRYIYPTQQVDVSKLISNLSSDDNVRYIIIFGSSISNRCHIESDLDVYVCCNEKKKVVYNEPERLEAPVDLWTNFDISDDENLYSEIMEKGVLVYER